MTTDKNGLLYINDGKIRPATWRSQVCGTIGAPNTATLSQINDRKICPRTRLHRNATNHAQLGYTVLMTE